MSPHLQTIHDCEAKLAGASDILAMLSGLFIAIDSLDQADAHAVARAGRFIAEDWSNMLDVDAEKLRLEAASMAKVVRP